MMRIFKFISHIERFPGDRTSRPIKDKIIRADQVVHNCYSSERDSSEVPAGTEILCDFGGDFGLYGTADIGGILCRVKIDLKELHKLDFSDHAELIADVVGEQS